MTKGTAALLLCALVAVALALAVDAARVRSAVPREARTGVRREASAAFPFPYSVQYYDNHLDHFNYNTQPQTYKQRYVYVDHFWDGKGPIFFYTGNEGDIVWFMENTGLMFDIAPQFNALLVFGEHRYYGDSLPFGAASFDTGKVDYLTVEQALADFAELLVYVKGNIAKCDDCNVISFGGSYGGMLSAWFRLKYPNVVDGSLACSAPVFGFLPDADPYAFDRISTQDFDNVNGCGDAVRAAMKQIQSLSQSSTGRAQLTSAFKLCDPLTPNNYETFISWIVNGFVNLATVDYPYPADFLKHLPAWPVKYSCAEIAAAPSTPFAGVYFPMQLYYNDTKSEVCFNTSDLSEGSVGDEAWDYQACGELQLVTASNGVSDFYPAQPFDPAQYTEYCQTRWGVTPRYDWMLLHFGGPNMLGASNIVFSNGLLDPWSGLSPKTDLSDTAVVYNITLGAHHLDLRWSNPADPQCVKDARAFEVAHIKQWIAEADERKLRDA